MYVFLFILKPENRLLKMFEYMYAINIYLMYVANI